MCFSDFNRVVVDIDYCVVEIAVGIVALEKDEFEESVSEEGATGFD